MKILILISLLAFISSCRKSSKTSSANGDKTEPIETDMYGQYQALLAPLNKTVSGHLNGALTLAREDDQFIANVRLSNGPVSILHGQNIHIGERCPDENDDVNLDGFIDGDEGAAVYREILIPLDEDLSSQRMGGGTFPVANEFGYYFYSKATSYEKLFQDLMDEDINHEDDFTKLVGVPGLLIKDKVVVILGVPETTVLPDTVAGRGRVNKHAALPIACGVIRRLGPNPGRIDDDHTNIPVPEGESVGGSSGSDDGANFPPEVPTTGGTTGDYGDEGGFLR